MISEENVKYSLRNLGKRKARSFLTILSIFVGIATIFIFISFGWGLYDYVDELSTGGSADKFMIQGRGLGAPGLSDITFSQNDLDTVSKTRGVLDLIGYYFKVVEVTQGKTKRFVFISASDPKTDLLIESFGIDVEKGRNVQTGDTNKVALGYNYQIDNKIFPKGLKLNDKIEINGQDFKVIGFFESIGNPQDDSNIYMSEEGFLRLFPNETDYTMLVGRAPLDDMDGTIERAKKELRKNRNEAEGAETFTIQSFQDQIEAFGTVLNIIIGFIVLVALISVVVSAINTANTMITSVLERIKEIGIIKSIGAKNSEIFNIFLFESSFLGFVAGAIGVLVGWAFSSTTANVLANLGWGFLSPHYSWYLFAGCVAFATIVGAISGVAPAYQASKLKPTEALRYE
ncbi:ABC transporter permease [Candidatus Woesearchaeota archaeon]|nr:ABC transporter permease [Candidatus Woesearchaeota archaeon]